MEKALQFCFFAFFEGNLAYNWAQFHQRSTYSFYARSSQKRKNSVKLSVSFYAFWIYVAVRRTLMKLSPGVKEFFWLVADSLLTVL